MRRSLSPVLIEKYSIDYVKDKPHISKNDNKLRNVLEKLKTSVTLRDNILYIFSYLLHGRENGLTEDQYTSLQILYEFLKKKTVYIYNLVPILFRLDIIDKNRQTAIILLALIKNLPFYLQCTARFLINEIKQERIDLNKLFSQTTSETFNYLTNIDLSILKSKINIVGDEMKGYDKYSNITQKALGPVFVKLFYNLQTHAVSLSQELFGLILINLPNSNDDPVLEENIRYLYDLTKNNIIDHKTWDLIEENPTNNDAYTLVFSILSKILASNVGMVVKNAAAYVYHHLRLVMTPTYDNSNIIYLHRLIKQDIDIGMLLLAIVPQDFGPDAIRSKDHLVTYFTHNYRNGDLDKILDGFNKFAYRDPLDLLIAFLTRLVNRIPSFPNSSLQTIQQSVTSLLSTLILKKSTRTFTPFVSPEIDILILIESLKIPDIEPVFQSAIDSIKFELIAQPQLSVLVSTLLPTEKYNCLTPIQCLMYTFQKIQKLRDNLSITLMTNIQTVTYILKSRLTQLQNYFIPQFFIPSINTDIAYFNVTNYEIKQKSQKIRNNLDDNLYKWNLKHYYNMTPNVTPDVQLGLLGNVRKQITENTKRTTKQMKNIIYIKPTKTKQTTKQMENTTYIEPTKMKIESSTIANQAQISNHVKSNKLSQESLSDQLLISSSAATSIYDDFSETTNKSLQKSEKEQPQSISVTPNIVEVRESDGSLNTKEREISPHSNISEKIESQSYPFEEINKDITMKKFKVKKTHKNDKRKKNFAQRTTKTVKPITITTTISPNTESKINEKQESKIISHATEKEFSFQPSVSEENESQMYSLEEMNKDITTEKPTSSVKTIHKIKKEETNMSEKTINNVPENITTLLLPPSIEPNEPLKIQLLNDDIPIVTPDDHNKTVSGLVLPKITELLKPANISDFSLNNDTPIVTQVLQPLSGIFGKNYIKKILQDKNINVYPTNIALLLAVFKKAITYQQVTTNMNLMNLIQKYISAIEYISPTILLPIVVSLKKLVSKVVYSTFNIHNLTQSIISERPLVKTTSDTITIPLVNPKIWLQSINPSDPYADLLPTLEEESAFAKAIQPLKNILTSKKIVEILGSDFQPLVYPNKGTLLIMLLQKLRKTKTMQSDLDLQSLINMYICAIEIPSMNTQVSEDNLVKMMSETTGQWQPELTSLITALPTAKNIVEAAMIQQIKQLLIDSTLLEKLHITKPSSTMSRGELLHKIILSALSGKMHLKKEVLEAFEYYKDKVEFTDMGALPIVWVWVEMYVVKAEINLGSMIQQTVDFNQLTYKEKIAYNDLIIYLADNSILLEDEDFDFQKYKTQGQFIRGLFKHLLKKPQINEKIKKDIQKIHSRVMLTGPGTIPIPNLSEF